MKFSSLARNSVIASALAIGLTLAAATPSFGWSSSITYQQPGGCVNGSLVGQSWHPAPYESRSTSASAGNCSVYYVINQGALPYLFAALRYTSGGNSAGAGTTSGIYVTTTGYSHYSYYLGGYHSWGSVVLYS